MWRRPGIEKRMLPLLLMEKISDYWLDIGTGDGIFSIMINSKYGIIPIQIDINKFNVINIGFVGDLKKLPIRKSCLKGMLCSQVLHYIPTPHLNNAIHDLLGKLEVDGEILIIEYLTDRSYSWIPYPIQLSQFNENPEIEIIQYKEIPDRGRSKFAVLIRKK